MDGLTTTDIAKNLRIHICGGCGCKVIYAADEMGPGAVCKVCEPRYPPSLLKAVCDQFDYALKLRTGEVLRFQSAEIHGNYVTLTLIRPFLAAGADEFPQDDLPYLCPRGIDVRVKDIVWCADAPDGS